MECTCPGPCLEGCEWQSLEPGWKLWLNKPCRELSPVCPVGRWPTVHGAETALFGEGQPGSYSTRSRKLSRTPGLGGCPALGSH